MPKILVSMIAYRERYLKESVEDCYKKALHPEDLIFSIVSEQEDEKLHPDLSFIPKNQIIYRKYDLSTYRGVLWSRAKTLEVDAEYDYILYTCGHNRFTPGWDEKTLEEYKNISKKAEKVVLTVSGPEYGYLLGDVVDLESPTYRKVNMRRPKIQNEYIPGYGWVGVENFGDSKYSEEVYLQFSWVFAPKEYVLEVPLDPDMNYHGEEIYTTVQTWCRGWRMFTTETILYYHDTYKKYPGEEVSRMTTHRPWSDLNKESFWRQSDESMIKLNLLLSGNLDGIYGNIEAQKVLEYANFSGLDVQWCTYDPDYHRMPIKRHAEGFRVPPRPEVLD